MQIHGSAILSASYAVEININKDNIKIGEGENEEEIFSEEGKFDDEGNLSDLPKMEVDPSHPITEDGENKTEGLVEEQESIIQDNQNNVELISPKEQTEGETESLDQEETPANQIEAQN